MARTDERSLQQTPAEVHQPLHASNINLPPAPTFRHCRPGHLLPAQLEFFAEDDELTVIPYFSLETDNSTFNSIAVSKAAAVSTHSCSCTCCRCGTAEVLVQGDYGPFQPSFPVKVPLWLAVMLHKRKKCRIAPPDWMQSDHLQGEASGPNLINLLPGHVITSRHFTPNVGVLEAERSTAAVFQPLPFRYLEVAHVLLNDAKDSFSAEEYYKVALFAASSVCAVWLWRLPASALWVLSSREYGRGVCGQVRDVLEQVRRVRSNKINAGLQLLVGPITVKLNNLSAMEINTIRPFFQGSLDRFYSLSQVGSGGPVGNVPSCLCCSAVLSLMLPFTCCADGRPFLRN